MENLSRKLRGILKGSKAYQFEYGVNGMTVLVLQSYNTNEEIRLDLSVLFDNEEVLQEMFDLANEVEKTDWDEE